MFGFFESVILILLTLFALAFVICIPYSLVVELYRMRNWKKIIGRIVGKGDPIVGDMNSYPILLEYWVNGVRHIGKKSSDSGMIGDTRLLLYNPKKPGQFTDYRPGLWFLKTILCFFYFLYVFFSLFQDPNNQSVTYPTYLGEPG